MLDVWAKVAGQYTIDDQRHYQFTPRDMTSWVYGVIRYASEGGNLFEALMYEGQRLFGDRMVSVDEATRVAQAMQMVFQGQWQASFDTSVLYTSWSSQSAAAGRCVPLGRLGLDDATELVAAKLVNYEREQKQLNLVLFPELLHRIARIDRVISEPGGHVLLAGRAGVGRRSALTVAAYMLRMEMYSPNMTRSYDLKAFFNDLRAVVQSAGVEGKPTLLHLEDHQVSCHGLQLQSLSRTAAAAVS